MKPITPTTKQEIKTCIDAAIVKMSDLGVALSEYPKKGTQEHAAEVFGAVVMLQAWRKEVVSLIEWQDATKRESAK